MDLPLASEPGYRVKGISGVIFYPTMSLPHGKKVFVCPKCGEIWARQYSDSLVSWSTIVHTCPTCAGDLLTVPGSFWFLWEKFVPPQFTIDLMVREFNLWVTAMEKDNGRVY